MKSQIERISRNAARLENLLAAHPELEGAAGFAHCPPDEPPQISFHHKDLRTVLAIFDPIGWERRPNQDGTSYDFFKMTIFGVILCVRRAEPVNAIQQAVFAREDLGS